jgi:hypothetical protein
MTAFVVVAISNPAGLATAIGDNYQDNYIRVSDSVWIVSDLGTSQDVTTKLKITTTPPGPAGPPGPNGTGIAFAISGYFGHANPAIWEFLRNKG